MENWGSILVEVAGIIQDRLETQVWFSGNSSIVLCWENNAKHVQLHFVYGDSYSPRCDVSYFDYGLRESLIKPYSLKLFKELIERII